MKTKEQLAEEYALERFHKKQLRPDLEKTAEILRNTSEDAFIAGFDARDAQFSKLDKLPEIKAAKQFWLDIDTPYGDPCDFVHTEDPHETAKKLGTHPCISATIHVIEYEPVAKIIAAKDAKLEMAKEHYKYSLDQKDEKIRELEMNLASGSLDVLKQYKQLQAANSLIGELENIQNKIANPDEKSWVTEKQQAHRALEKIKQYKQGDR